MSNHTTTMTYFSIEMVIFIFLKFATDLLKSFHNVINVVSLSMFIFEI